MRPDTWRIFGFFNKMWSWCSRMQKWRNRSNRQRSLWPEGISARPISLINVKWLLNVVAYSSNTWKSIFQGRSLDMINQRIYIIILVRNSSSCSFQRNGNFKLFIDACQAQDANAAVVDISLCVNARPYGGKKE